MPPDTRKIKNSSSIWSKKLEKTIYAKDHLSICLRKKKRSLMKLALGNYKCLKTYPFLVGLGRAAVHTPFLTSLPTGSQHCFCLGCLRPCERR